MRKRIKKGYEKVYSTTRVMNKRAVVERLFKGVVGSRMVEVYANTKDYTITAYVGSKCVRKFRLMSLTALDQLGHDFWKGLYPEVRHSDYDYDSYERAIHMTAMGLM